MRSITKKILNAGIFVDPAFSSSNNSDDAVALLLGRHKLTGDYYLIDQYADTSAPSKTFLAILNMFDKGSSRVIYCFNDLDRRCVFECKTD